MKGYSQGAMLMWKRQGAKTTQVERICSMLLDVWFESDDRLTRWLQICQRAECMHGGEVYFKVPCMNDKLDCSYTSGTLRTGSSYFAHAA